MARRSTLKDLNEFLSQNPSEIEVDDVKTKEDFLNKSPNNIVRLESSDNERHKKDSRLQGVSMAEIALYIHERAKFEKKSFTELWLEIIAEGAKLEPLLKNTSPFQTIRKINRTTFNVAMEGITQLIKNR